MNASRWSILLLALIVGSACWLAGCGSGDTGGDGENAGGPTKVDQGDAGTVETPKPKPVFEGWKDATPEAVLVFSGQTLGYIEPCGCAPETLAGGIGRRHDLLRQIEKRGWPVAAFDLGTTVRRARKQSQIKFDTVRASYRDMGYAGIGLGPADLNLGTNFLYALHADAATDNYLPFVSANVTWYDTPDLPGGPWPFLLKTVGTKKVAITSVTVDDASPRELVTSEVSLGDPEAAIAAVVPKIDAENPDVRVLLAHCKEETARKLLAKFPMFDIVVCTGPEEPANKPQTVGKTLLFSVGKKGKYVGVVGLFADSDKRMQYELVHLDRFRFDETDVMHDHMRTYQKRLEDERIAGEGDPVKHPREALFVGAKVCGQCHTKAYAKWSTSPHARAFESLKTGHDPHSDKGEAYPDSEHEWISRVFDPECLACHVTGWDAKDILRYESGFLNAKFAKTDEERKLEELLAGQQCENCHGPGSRHTELELSYRRDRKSVTDEDLRAGRREMDLMVVLDPETNKPAKAVRNEQEVNLCYSCHDTDNSPKFDFATYWEKVRHPGKD